MSKFNALMDLETAEVSLVSRGANRKVFAITKKEGESAMANDVIKAIKSAPFEHAEKLAELLKQGELSEDAMAALTDAMKLLSAFQEEIPEDFWRQMLALAGLPEGMEEARAQEEEEEVESQEGDDEMDKQEDDEEEMEKSLAKAPEAVREKLRSLWKDRGEAGAKLEAVQKELDKERDLRITKEYQDRAAKDFAGVPGITTIELGSLLKNLDLLDGKLAKKVQGILKASALVAKSSNLTKEIGSSRGAAAGGDALKKAQNLAAEMVAKDSKLTKEKAFATVLKANPGLYADYRKEQYGN